MSEDLFFLCISTPAISSNQWSAYRFSADIELNDIFVAQNNRLENVLDFASVANNILKQPRLFMLGLQLVVQLELFNQQLRTLFQESSLAKKLLLSRLFKRDISAYLLTFSPLSRCA